MATTPNKDHPWHKSNNKFFSNIKKDKSPYFYYNQGGTDRDKQKYLNYFKAKNGKVTN